MSEDPKFKSVFIITYPSLEAAVAALCEKVFGAAIEIQSDDPVAPTKRTLPSACPRCGKSGVFLWGDESGTNWRCLECHEKDQIAGTPWGHSGETWQQWLGRQQEKSRSREIELAKWEEACREKDKDIDKLLHTLADRNDEIASLKESLADKGALWPVEWLKERDDLKARIAELETPRYRMLKVGERLQKGDEFDSTLHGWRATEAAGDKVYPGEVGRYRRRIEV